jgi:CRISPR-associated endonuclease Cas2
VSGLTHLLVCYDIPTDARRKKLHDGLGAFLERVQFSVFEGWVSVRSHARVVRLVEDLIDRDADNVRIYRLGPGPTKVAVYGKAFEVATEPEDIIIG